MRNVRQQLSTPGPGFELEPFGEVLGSAMALLSLGRVLVSAAMLKGVV